MQRLADSRGPAARPVIASAGELAPLVRGTARAHSRGSVFMALPPGPRRRGSKPGLLVATSMGSALEGVAIRGEWPHIAVTRVRPPSRTTLLPGCGNGPKNGPKTPYGAYRAILVPVRFRGADLLGVSGSVEHPGRIVLTSLSLRPVSPSTTVTGSYSAAAQSGTVGRCCLRCRETAGQPLTFPTSPPPRRLRLLVPPHATRTGIAKKPTRRARRLIRLVIEFCPRRKCWMIDIGG